jgi:predicted ester cyclase
MMKMQIDALGILALGTLAMMVGCASGPSTAKIEQQNMAIVRQAHADLAAGTFDAFKAAVSSNYVRHCQAMPAELQELRGTEQFFAFIEEFMVAVPVYQDSLSNMIAEGDKVAYISTISGTQTGPMGELPASGKSFTLVNIIIQRLENGKVAETWVSWDNVAFMSQLGFMP